MEGSVQTTLIHAIKDNINQGTTIYSNFWRDYKTDELRRMLVLIN
jgi:hypothetical protein